MWTSVKSYFEKILFSLLSSAHHYSNNNINANEFSFSKGWCKTMWLPGGSGQWEINSNGFLTVEGCRPLTHTAPSVAPTSGLWIKCIFKESTKKWMSSSVKCCWVILKAPHHPMQLLMRDIASCPESPQKLAGQVGARQFLVTQLERADLTGPTALSSTGTIHGLFPWQPVASNRYSSEEDFS